MPYSVYMWLNSPYVSSTVYTDNSAPFLLDEYLMMNARYDFIRNDCTRDDLLNNIGEICRVLNIRLNRIDWDALESLD